MVIFCKKNAHISKIKRTLGLKGIFSETEYACVLMYQIPSFWPFFIFLMSFRQVGKSIPVPPPHTPQNEPLNIPPRLELKL